MITKIESSFRAIRRFFSRNEWAARLLRLPASGFSPGTQGLIMIQIDGLSRGQLNRALEKGNLPFLKRLLNHERYAAHSLYSGLPSNTPTVQAEIFYGKKTAVPAFCFQDKETGGILRMYDNPAAELIESRLKKESRGLLEGGSSYCNIFSGGAEEAHFCASKTGWQGVLSAVNPLLWPFWFICYVDVFLRTIFLMVVEFFLAIIDCLRGTLKGKIFKKEFEFIAARVMVCVLMRELIVVGACMDISRGLPVIHLNFIGYDEQAHRRGPSSAFAHWSLKGIDDAIRRIWDAAGRAKNRNYDVWVYSDHGQERTVSYRAKYGRTMEEAVQKIFGREDFSSSGSSPDQSGSETWHTRESFFNAESLKTDSVLPVTVTAMGPVGHLYPARPLSSEEIDSLGLRLVTEAGIPLVVVAGEPGKARAWTARGQFILPEQRAEVFGENHPFLEEAAQDLVSIAHHECAGAFTILGWAAGAQALSFPLEGGAHAGITPEETNAFALLPQDAPLTISKKYLRPLDLREAAQRVLGREQSSYFLARRQQAVSQTLRIMTYNTHGCVGMDGQLSVERICRVIARHDPDIVALQELDVCRSRSLGVDQAERIARKLEMQFHFHPVFRFEDEQYGNAILSRYPMSIIKMAALPASPIRKDPEPRGALWVSVELNGLRVQLINTHLSIWPKERAAQAKALTGPEWLSHPDCKGPVILCGDFNAQPRSISYRRLCAVLADCQKMLLNHRPRRTWLGRYPLTRIDHILLSSQWEVTDIEVPRTSLTRVASDHLPLVVDLKIVSGKPSRTA